MKRVTICVAAALVAALATGVMTGCSSQPASSASGSESASASAESASGSESASASAAAEQSQDEIIAELKDALKNPPAFKSVTVTEDTVSTLSADAEAEEPASSESAPAESSEAASSESAAADEANTESDTIAAKTVYKFDESGDTVRTSMTCEIDDITLTYFTEGEEAVCVTDGPVYSGTVEQFDLPHAAGSEAYLRSATGDLNTIVECIATATKSQQDGMTVYELVLDPAKRIASDEIFQLLADNGDPVLSESIIVGFDENGYLVWANEKREFKASSMEKNLMLTDFDSTVVDPMPEADKTYEEMEADIDKKYEELFADLDKVETAEGAAPSETAEVK